MNKYGIENFFIETIEKVDDSKQNLEDREKYWISYYNTFKDGYNATIGGDGKSYVDYDLILSYWNQGKLEKEISEIMQIDQETVMKALNLNGVTSEEIKQRAINFKSKKIKRIDNEGNIEIFNSIAEAYKDINKPNSSHIQEVCNGKRKQAYGYKWEWV